MSILTQCIWAQLQACSCGGGLPAAARARCGTARAGPMSTMAVCEMWLSRAKRNGKPSARPSACTPGTIRVEARRPPQHLVRLRLGPGLRLGLGLRLALGLGLGLGSGLGLSLRLGVGLGSGSGSGSG
eukprot:scaffold19996_cov64-Phaeocystis_antarctica.AAC.2